MELIVDKDSIIKFKQAFINKGPTTCVTFSLTDSKILNILDAYVLHDISNIINNYCAIIIKVNCDFSPGYNNYLYTHSIRLYTILTSFVVFDCCLKIDKYSNYLLVQSQYFQYGDAIKCDRKGGLHPSTQFNDIIWFNEFIKIYGNIKDKKKDKYIRANDRYLYKVYYCGKNIFQICDSIITIDNIEKMKIIIEIIKILIDNT